VHKHQRRRIILLSQEKLAHSNATAMQRPMLTDMWDRTRVEPHRSVTVHQLGRALIAHHPLRLAPVLYFFSLSIPKTTNLQSLSRLPLPSSLLTPLGSSISASSVLHLHCYISGLLFPSFPLDPKSMLCASSPQMIHNKST
jgi:hypothetical protein